LLNIKQHTITKQLCIKKICLFFIAISFVFNTLAQSNNTKLKSIKLDTSLKLNSQKPKATYNSFYSDELIFVNKNAILSLQIENIELHKNISGKGILHIANQKNINLTATKPLTVANIKIENTQIDLKTELHTTGKITLNKASVKLNQNNLITEQPIVFLDKTSKIIENGTGVWINLPKYQQNPISQNTTKDQQTTNSFINLQEVKVNIPTFALNLQTTNTNLKKYFEPQVPEPPPKKKV